MIARGDSDLPMLEFETERLFARRLQPEDKSLFCSLYTDPLTMQFVGEHLSSEHASRQFLKALARWQEDQPPSAVLTVLTQANREAIGICAVSGIDALKGRAEVGIMLAPQARSSGYAREALGGLVRQVYSTFPVEEIRVRCSALNPVVERMVGSIGFALSEDPAVVDGPLSQRVWTVHRSTWSGIK